MKALRTVLGLVFIAAGILHFVRPRLYEQIMPERLPMHKESVLVSGIAEVVGGAALLHGRTARFGFWWLTALLIAVFPANVQYGHRSPESSLPSKEWYPALAALGPATTAAGNDRAAGAGHPACLISADVPTG
jgi:uncharacterized membrane protein